VSAVKNLGERESIIYLHTSQSSIKNRIEELTREKGNFWGTFLDPHRKLTEIEEDM